MKSLRLLLLPATLLALALPLARPAIADAPSATTAAAGTPVDAAQAQKLIDAIQDPAARAQLVAQLRLLAAAEGAKPAPPPPGLAALLGDALDSVRDTVVSAATSFPRLAESRAWLTRQFAPENRGMWLELLVQFAIILGLPGVAALLARGLLASPRGRLDQLARRGPALAAAAAFGRWLLDLGVAALFGVAAAGLSRLTVLEPQGPAAQLVVLLIAALALAGAGVSLASALLRPDRPSARPLPVSDSTALHLSRWVRRLLVIGIGGAALVAVLTRLGLPRNGDRLVELAVGLVFTAMLVAAVLQLRRAAAAWIRNRRGPFASWRAQIAKIWYLPVVLYLVAAFLVWALAIPGGFAYLLEGGAWTLALIAAAGAALPALDRLVAGAGRPGKARRARYLALAARVARLTIFAVVLLGLLQAWGLDIWAALATPAGRRLFGSLATIAVVIAASVVAWETVTAEIDHHVGQLAAGQTRRELRLRTLLPLVRNVMLIFILLVAGLIVLDQLGVNIAPLLAGAGVIGVAIGFGAQRLVQDVITGSFILIEDSVAVNDTVGVAGLTGTVEALSVRSLRLRDDGGNLHTVPFSAVTTISNFSRDFSFATLTLSVPPGSDIERVVAAIEETGREIAADRQWAEVVTGPFTLVGIDSFGANALVIMARVRTLPGRAADIRHEFNWRVKHHLDAIGITLGNLPNTTIVVEAAAPSAVPQAPAPRGRATA